MGKRSERLIELMQVLRRRRRPVAGQLLADEMGVSLRSLYRDIETLKSMGAAIDGEAGLGFQLRADTFLPPLMFTDEELEAVVLGLRTLTYGPDRELGRVARDTSSKIAAVLPPGRRQEMESIGLFAVPPGGVAKHNPVLTTLRTAIREERQLQLSYRDKAGAETQRVVYAVALGYYEGWQAIIAWCTLRQDFRSFMVAGILEAALLDVKLPEPRRTLFHRWRTLHDLPDLT